MGDLYDLKNIYDYSRRFPAAQAKNRNLWDISNRLQNAIEIQSKFRKTKWKKWYEKALKVGSFWAPDKDNRAFILHCTEEGYSHDWIDNYKTFNDRDRDAEKQIRMMDPKEIPLLLEDPKFEKHKKTIEGLLDGSIQHYIYRPDLIKQFQSLEIRQNHLSYLCGAYEGLLKNYLIRNFRDMVYDKWRQDALFIVTINNVAYHLFFGRQDELNFVSRVFKIPIDPNETIFPENN